MIRAFFVMPTLKFTNKYTDAMCKAFEAGAPVTTVCNVIGLNRNTYYAWIKKAKLYVEEDESTHKFKEFYDWHVKVQKAQANAITRAIEKLLQLGSGYEVKTVKRMYQIKESGEKGEELVTETTKHVVHPQAIMFWLERVHPSLFGSNTRFDSELLKGLLAGQLGRMAGQPAGELSEGVEQTNGDRESEGLAVDKQPEERKDWSDL